MADNENSTSSYVELNFLCQHISGDHEVTGIHGGTQQGKSLPTIYPEAKV